MEQNKNRWKWLPLEKLTEAPWNYKADDQRMEETLVNNLRRNGQVINLLVRELDDGTYEVVNGNHRLRALREINAASALCFDLGKITTPEAKRIAVETNEVVFTANQERLTKVLTEIVDRFGIKDIASTTPYSVIELRDRMEFFDFLVRSSNPMFATEDFQAPGVDPPTLTLAIEGLTEAEMQMIQRAFDATNEPMDGDALLFICRSVGKKRED